MPKVVVLVAASPTAAFYSQIAALRRALLALDWRRWETGLCVFVGGEPGDGSTSEWLPFLPDTAFVRASSVRSERYPIWAQSDDIFRVAPWVADVFVVMDADTLPVAGFEDVLDEVASRGCMAGVIAHNAPPPFPGMEQRKYWETISDGLVAQPLDFDHRYSLLPESTPIERRESPFYVNFGVVFFARTAYSEMAPAYLRIRDSVEPRMHAPYFSGQVALTLAAANTATPTWSLPMRFNFPNDPGAAELYPQEAENAVIYHYLRTLNFDRQRIFSSQNDYEAFLRLELTGVDRAFRDCVCRQLGSSYPFSTDY